jgi:type VI secretion system protein ImpA
MGGERWIMGAIDVDSLLEPVSEDLPSGEDLEYDEQFGALERAAEGKPGHVMGDEEIPPEPPKWDEVSEAALELLGRTKDLRVASHLAHAQLNLEGINGFASGLQLLNGLVHQYWDNVYPMLDEEDDNDPTLRINSLAALNSRDGMVGSLDRAILVSSRALGRFSLRDIRIASGELSPQGDEEAPDPTHIDAAFQDCELDELTGTAAAVDDCRDTVADFESFIKEQVGTEYAPDVSVLSAELDAVRAILKEQLARRGIEQEGDGADGDSAAVASGASAASGEIRSREDAVRAIDRLCDYFNRNEPSSPVPLLLQRAKRLIAKDFLEILRDLTPDGVSQAEMIGGVDREDY